MKVLANAVYIFHFGWENGISGLPWVTWAAERRVREVVGSEGAASLPPFGEASVSRVSRGLNDCRARQLDWSPLPSLPIPFPFLPPVLLFLLHLQAAC